MAAGSLGDLAVKMRQRAERIPNLANAVAIAATKEMFEHLLVVTPVLTTEAVSNWQISLGIPHAEFVFAHSDGVRSISISKARGEAYESLPYKQPGVPIWVSNTAPHIIDLNRGSSTQFAGGFFSGGKIVFRLAAKAALAKLLD